MLESRLGAQAMARTCQLATGMWNGRNILEVDMPSTFDSRPRTKRYTSTSGTATCSQPQDPMYFCL
ncbi:GTPase IMAP family member 5 [Myotis brandtii]|uniref:GTPase IMAP family member 5 n=1 Tax=Myotis brandtii TaxID=109478 RepID=S7MWB0_MYOBR|nr:GTPase IMAP family member 5 [Myotis brandtii]